MEGYKILSGCETIASKSNARYDTEIYYVNYATLPDV